MMKGLAMASDNTGASCKQPTFFEEPENETPSVLTFHTEGYLNHKDCSFYWVWKAFDNENRIIAENSSQCDENNITTINEAKTQAVIEALRWIEGNMPDEPVTVLCDLQHVVKTINGVWKAHRSKMLCHIAKQHLRRTKAKVEWVSHEMNGAA
jgi:ribonuclease HI